MILDKYLIPATDNFVVTKPPGRFLGYSLHQGRPVVWATADETKPPVTYALRVVASSEAIAPGDDYYFVTRFRRPDGTYDLFARG